MTLGIRIRIPYCQWVSMKWRFAKGLSSFLLTIVKPTNKAAKCLGPLAHRRDSFLINIRSFILIKISGSAEDCRSGDTAFGGMTTHTCGLLTFNSLGLQSAAVLPLCLGGRGKCPWAASLRGVLALQRPFLNRGRLTILPWFSLEN